MAQKYMTREETRIHDEQNRDNNLRLIRAKIVNATPRELALLAAFIRGLGIIGWSESEYNRSTEKEASA